MAERLVVMAHFDLVGDVAAHVRRHVLAWNELGVRLVVVTTSRLLDSARTWLEQYATVIERSNYGYDFLSYKIGLAESGPLEQYDEVVLCNDTFIGPLRPYREIFATMADRPVDFWGITRTNRVAPHLQSFFVVFRPWVVASHAFTDFWSGMVPISDRKQVIRRYEVGMSRTLVEAGFVFGSYFTETAEDTRQARRRVVWWAIHRPPGLRPSTVRSGALLKRAQEPWNTAVALADRALPSGRLPLVKLDTLRYDPYHLGADRLLAKCEKAFPEQFAGVADFIAQTSSTYVVRPGERTLDTPVWARPAQPAVGY